MKLTFKFWAIVSILIVFCNTLGVQDSTEASACIYYEQQFNWNCVDTGKSGHGHGKGGGGSKGGYDCYCKSLNWLQSITNCIYNATTSVSTRKHAYEHIMKRCERYANLTLDHMYQYQENGTHYLVNYSPKAKIYPVNGTLRANQTDFDWYYVKFAQYTTFMRRTKWLSWGLVFYWVFVISIDTLFNVNKRMLGFTFLSKYSNLLNKTIFIPSMFKDYHDRTYVLLKCLPFDFPTRSHGLIMTVFVIITVIFAGIGYSVTLPHPYLSTRWYANILLVSYRSDLMSMALFPMIFFFGSRNNPFMVLTGFSYATFSFYHKWCAYICTVLAFVHTMVWTMWAIYIATYSNALHKKYWQWGIAAITLLFALISHSEKVIRNYMYETFLLLHQSMSIIFIICIYFHVDSYGWLGWVWSMVGIYSFDRFMRLVRVILHGGIINANLQDCGNGIIKMTVKKPKYLTYQAGNYAFVYFLTFSRYWFYSYQSHPFTVLNGPTKDPKDPQTLIFYFRAHKGVTRSVLSRLLKSGKESINCKILLEGPYNTQLPQMVKPNSNTVGMAAGLGISAVYPHLYEVLKHSDGDEKAESGFQHKLIWIIRDMNYLNWFSKELDWLKSKNCDVIVIVTAGDSSVCDLDSESSSKSLAKELSKNTENITVEQLGCKPDLFSIVSTEIRESSAYEKDITFFGCGPEAFNDALRSAVASAIPSDAKIKIEFESESFVW